MKRLCLICLLVITLVGCTTTEPEYHSRDWDGDESYILAQLAMYEAGDKDITAKITAINIAINRVWSDDYPDTIEAVVDDMTDGEYVNIEPDAESLDAEHHVQIDGWDLSDGSTEFIVEDDQVILETEWEKLSKSFQH